MDSFQSALNSALASRFGADIAAPVAEGCSEGLARLALHRVHRKYREEPVDARLVKLLCACALSAPSKSDLQQRDIVIVQDPVTRSAIADLLPHMPWVRTAPVFIVFVANARRLMQVSSWRGKPFPNSHLDLFFNAVGDAAIALAWFQTAAEAVGLGGCPISEVRNHATLVSEWLRLPELTLPFAGFCLGWPLEPGQISPRLPLDVTLHYDTFDDCGLREQIDAYDQRRQAVHPYPEQRDVECWGHSELYGWSEEKARHYAQPQRSDFGAFVRKQKFDLT
jgi:nitroreductase